MSKNWRHNAAGLEDGKQREAHFLHKRYLSREGIAPSLACDLSAFDDSPFGGEMQTLMQVFQTKVVE